MKQQQNIMLLFAVLMWFSISPVLAETEVMPEMDHGAMPSMDHGNMHSMDHGLHENKDDSEDESKEDSKEENKTPVMEHNTNDGSGHEMDHGNMHGMDHGAHETKDENKMPVMERNTNDGPVHEMDHSNMHGMDHGSAQPMDHSNMTSMDVAVSHDMSEISMQGGSAPADARDPHAYSNGLTFGPGPKLRLADEHYFASLLFDRLESARTSDTTVTIYDVQAWFGRDYDRAVFKAEGHVEDGKLEEGSAELVWGHALTAYWDTQLGVRHDSNEGIDRNWLAFGVQGLAPYWFEVDATAYIGTEGRTALGFEAEYELPFTQQLIMQPRLEAMIYGKEDKENGVGAGLSELAIGVRLRYEIKREFGPYIGIEWESLHGDTASMARDAGLDTKETMYVAGVRMWF